MKKLISMFLVLVMSGCIAACGSTSTTKESTPAANESIATNESKVEETTVVSEVEKKEPVSVSLFPSNGNLTSGTVGGWLGEYFAENGIILDVWAYSKDKYNAILASGDFPDVMFFPSNADFNVLIENGYLLDLNEYMDQLPAIKNNEEMQTAIKFVQKYVTSGTDKLGVMATKVGALSPKVNTGGCGININWELYEKIGCPEINCLEDTIEVFKQMQAEWPVSDTGVKTYAMHLYSSADNGFFAGANNVLKIMGYTNSQLPYFLAPNTETEEFEYLLEEDGVYKYALKYYNTLYKEGLLDPDSITYDRATVMSMVEEGSTLAGWPCVPAYETAGFMPIYFEDMRIIFTGNNTPYGGGKYIGISSKCENIDAALQLVNMFADPDCCFIIKTGPEGELWEYGTDGVPVLTDEGFEYFNNSVPADINGENFVNFNTPLVANTGFITSFGKPYSAGGWPESIAVKLDTEVANKWKEFYNAEDFCILLGDDCVTESFDDDLDKFVDKVSDEDELLFAAAQDIIIEASWKMVYAETDADFEKLWADAVAECEALGIKELSESRKEALLAAMEVRDSLK